MRSAPNSPARVLPLLRTALALAVVAATGGVLGQKPLAQAWAPVRLGSVISPPFLFNSLVLVGSAEGSLTAVNPTTGTVQWSQPTPDGLAVSCRPFAINGTVYFVTQANSSTPGGLFSVSGSQVMTRVAQPVGLNGTANCEPAFSELTSTLYLPQTGAAYSSGGVAMQLACGGPGPCTFVSWGATVSGISTSASIGPAGDAWIGTECGYIEEYNGTARASSFSGPPCVDYNKPWVTEDRLVFTSSQGLTVVSKHDATTSMSYLNVVGGSATQSNAVVLRGSQAAVFGTDAGQLVFTNPFVSNPQNVSSVTLDASGVVTTPVQVASGAVLAVTAAGQVYTVSGGTTGVAPVVQQQGHMGRPSAFQQPAYDAVSGIVLVSSLGGQLYGFAEGTA